MEEFVVHEAINRGALSSIRTEGQRHLSCFTCDSLESACTPLHEIPRKCEGLRLYGKSQPLHIQRQDGLTKPSFCCTGILPNLAECHPQWPCVAHVQVR